MPIYNCQFVKYARWHASLYFLLQCCLYWSLQIKPKTTRKALGELRPLPRTIVESSMMCKSATTTTLFVWICFHWSHHISTLAMLCYCWILHPSIEWHCWVQTSAKAKCNICKTETDLVNLSCDSDTLQNLKDFALAHATPSHQAPWKLVW